MSWLLDTNVLIHAQRGHPEAVRERLLRVPPADVAISAMTVAELWYGASKQPNPAVRRAAWSAFIADLTVLDFDRTAAERHGELRHELRNEPLGDRDLIIACTALVHGLTLVTANTREFRRVPGLVVEDWSE